MDVGDDKMFQNSGSSLKLPKEMKKIVKHENCLISSNGTVRGLLQYCFQDGRTEPGEHHDPRGNVMTYDTYTYVIQYAILGRTYIPLISHYSRKFPIVVFFHGGGFVMHYSNSSKYDELCRTLALELPCVVVSINYPLAPKQKCPTQYTHAWETLSRFDRKWLDNEFDQVEHTDTSNVFLAGDDAGGNIAHHLATKIALNETLLVNFKIKGLISIQPLFGGEERTNSEILLSKSPMLTLKQRDGLWKSFLPSHYDRDCIEVNVSGPNSLRANLRGFPRTLVITGGLDPLQDWQKRYYDWLRKRGVDARLVEYQEAIPQFYLYPKLGESKLLINEIRSHIYL